jgi:hypothetical protein
MLGLGSLKSCTATGCIKNLNPVVGQPRPRDGQALDIVIH